MRHEGRSSDLQGVPSRSEPDAAVLSNILILK